LVRGEEALGAKNEVADAGGDSNVTGEEAGLVLTSKKRRGVCPSPKHRTSFVGKEVVRVLLNRLARKVEKSCVHCGKIWSLHRGGRSAKRKRREWGVSKERGRKQTRER